MSKFIAYFRHLIDCNCQSNTKLIKDSFSFLIYASPGLDSEVKDLSNKGLKKIPKTEDSASIRVLVLDDNELQKVDNIDSFLRIEKVRSSLLSIDSNPD